MSGISRVRGIRAQPEEYWQCGGRLLWQKRCGSGDINLPERSDTVYGIFLNYENLIYVKCLWHNRSNTNGLAALKTTKIRIIITNIKICALLTSKFIYFKSFLISLKEQILKNTKYKWKISSHTLFKNFNSKKEHF